MAEQNTSAAAPENKKPAKPKKPKGPIRFEAIIPFLIFVAIVWAYFFFFFDNHLRRGLEYVGTQANGAEVNIGDIDTSFWKASLEIKTVQITDVDQPARNKIQIGEVRWGMMWDALLRGKIAIEDASILEIAIGVPRKKPGFVLPPPPPSEKSMFDKVREQALAKAKDEFSNNVLGDIGALLGGADPAAQLKTIEGTLKSSLRVKELETELKAKEVEWKERIANLPQQKDLENLQTRLKAVKTDNFAGPHEIQASVRELDSIFKEADAKYKHVIATKDQVGSDFANYSKAFKDLEGMVRQDIKDLENRLKIPKLDVQSLSKSIFGPLFLDRVKQAEFYMAKARDYMPPKKSPEEKEFYAKPKPAERFEGRNYKFGRPNSYPLFWLKHAAISSKHTKAAEWSGNIIGELKDVTDDPPVLGRPTIASFRGDFPAQELMGVDGKITINHVTNNPVDKAVIKVKSLPINGLRLVDSNEVKLGFDRGNASTEFTAELRGQEVKIASQTVFFRGGNNKASGAADDAGKSADSASPEALAANPAANDVAAQAQGQLSLEEQVLGSKTQQAAIKSTGFLSAQATQPLLNELLNNALSEIPRVTLNASVGGPWKALKFNIDSNLGRELGGAFDRQINAKIAQARANIENLVNQRVAAEKAKLEAEFNKLRSQFDATIKAKQAEIDKAKNQIENAKNEAINSEKKKLENEGKKAADELRKRLGF